MLKIVPASLVLSLAPSPTAGAENLHSQRECGALAEATREDGFSCEQIEGAEPLEFSDTVIIEVICDEEMYTFTLRHNGSHEREEESR